jgi:DNA-binding PucR family transcriptional regulator
MTTKFSVFKKGKHMNTWIGSIDEAIGLKGRICSNTEVLSPGEYLVKGTEVFFGLNPDTSLVYPKGNLSDQNCKLICMIIEQQSQMIDSRKSDPIASLLQKVVEGRANPFIEQEALKLGLNPSLRYLPILLERVEQFRKLKEIFESYFSCQIYHTMIAPWGYFLVPLHQLDLEEENVEELVELANGLAELVIEETGKNSLAVGLPVTSVSEWKTAFEKNKKAIFTGTTFFPERKVYFAWQMDLELMLFECSEQAKRNFVRDVFGKWKEKHLQSEYMAIVSTLLLENMNLSETARKLFIHRNTLNYRIDRFKVETGKDLRVAKDAYLVYIAFLLNKKR